MRSPPPMQALHGELHRNEASAAAHLGAAGMPVAATPSARSCATSWPINPPQRNSPRWRCSSTWWRVVHAVRGARQPPFALNLRRSSSRSAGQTNTCSPQKWRPGSTRRSAEATQCRCRRTRTFADHLKACAVRRHAASCPAAGMKRCRPHKAAVGYPAAVLTSSRARDFNPKSSICCAAANANMAW